MIWPTAAEWTAFWSAVLALSAIVALIVALMQLREFRQQRRDANRAYVLVSSDADRETQALYLVVENAGVTHATDVSISFDPPLKSGFSEEGLHSDAIWNPPLLPPGYSFRTMLDVADRADHELPMQFRANVSWRSPATDSDQVIEQSYEIDFDRFYGIRELVAQDQVKEQSKSLASIASSLEKIAQMTGGNF